MIKGMFGTTMRLSVDMQQSITKVSAHFFGVSWYKLHHLIFIILKSLLQMVDIFLITLYSSMLQLLLLSNYLLVVVPIPKLIVAFDMSQDSFDQILQLLHSIVFNRKFHKIVLYVVFCHIYHLLRRQKLLDMLKQIR